VAAVRPLTVATLRSHLSLSSQPPESWPDPPNDAAYRGLAGDIVRTIEPHTEADPVALLVQLLAAFGNAAGRASHFKVEATRHTTNLNVVLVGETSKARKGTSWDHTRGLVRVADPEWTDAHIASGLSSGEGLIWAVRDPIEKREREKAKDGTVRYVPVVADAGIEDKRLLVYESEFASTLRVLGRDGNTLSALIRQAWDNGDLRSLVKNSPARATGAHISIIGHITRDELRRYLDVTEAANGFGNRFLWICVRRSKLLPEGGRMHEVDVAPLVRRLSEVIEFARTADQCRFGTDARRLWHEVYPELSEGRLGLYGALTARAEAQTIRLALLYALLDLSSRIRAGHLRAALALWSYADRSVRHIFGTALGDPVADEILRALIVAAGEGTTRTEIANLFGRHKSGAEIGRALDLLRGHGLAISKQERTDGRPTERWFYAGANEANYAKEAVEEATALDGRRGAR